MRRASLCLALGAIPVVAALACAAAMGQTPDAPPSASTETPPANAASPEPFLSRVELYSAYLPIDRRLTFTGLTPFGALPLRVDSDIYEARGGLRLFSNMTPLPILDVSYRATGEDSDTTIFAPFGALTSSAKTRDHDFRLGAMAPIPGVGLFKLGVSDTETATSYGLYLVPQLGPVIVKLGVERAEISDAPDDSLYFVHATLPVDTWRFSGAFSHHERGHDLIGGQAGKWLGDFFVAGAYYDVEDARGAWGLAAGRANSPGQSGPTFWALHLNNHEYRRTNVFVAFGRPGVPKEAFDNPFADGMYTALFTDQMGTVLPIPVRSYEEMRVWKRPDEYAQPAAGSSGGLALSFDLLRADVGYEDLQAGVYYTHERLGPLLYPHIGPIIESEKFPGVGRQDLRYGVEVGAYLGGRNADKFYDGGRTYIGLSYKTDFDEYRAIMAEFRINF